MQKKKESEDIDVIFFVRMIKVEGVCIVIDVNLTNLLMNSNTGVKKNRKILMSSLPSKFYHGYHNLLFGLSINILALLSWSSILLESIAKLLASIQ